MKKVKIQDKVFEPYLSASEIDSAITDLAKRITRKYRGKDPVFIGILNGSFLFAADLLKKIEFDCEISFVKVASYQGTKSSGFVRQLLGMDQDISGRDVIVLEDVIDTGNTIEEVNRIISGMGANSVSVATLLFKPAIYEKEFPIEYVALEINPDFVVGYGLDYNGFGRNLNEIYVLSDQESIKADETMLNIVLFGPPGAGKGTQANLLKEKYQLNHLSTGDILRDEISNDTALGREAKSFMDKGELVPDEVVINMIDNCLKNESSSKGFIFDGFPRTTAQAKALDNLLQDHNQEIDFMISLEVDDEELVDRIIRRGKDSGREDDKNESVIFNRIVTYNKKTSKLKTYYEEQSKYYPISGTGSIDEIADRISEVISA